MRIIGGTHRGTHLADVGLGDAAAHLRPTSDRVREAIFNLLINGKLDGGPAAVPGARVLDLFAGTGALGLEALSRGAADAVFVDDGKAALALLQRNISLMRLEGRTHVQRGNACALGRNPGAGFTLLFLDPPYGKSLGEKALEAALQGGWIAPDAVIVWEERHPPQVPPSFTTIDQRKYGDTVITLLRAPSAQKSSSESQ
ncbi:MAG: 16S rRNA (guanine(966)-N(2))-methyltransferase RsmD [Pseudorhodobacter sp.]|nr:16S rRNA (guanine(966)-N(2))-methyltransferase RsmD [Pseudorhodobacter sp.]